MTALPRSSVLVRTWFDGTWFDGTWFDADGAWALLVAEAQTPSQDGFLADVTFVDDAAFAGLTADALTAAQPDGAIVSFLADEITLTSDDHPIVAVWVLPRPPDDVGPVPKPFRVVPSELWNVENNINLANMDWEERLAPKAVAGPPIDGESLQPSCAKSRPLAG